MSDKQSAPAFSTLSAILTISVTFGESFTMRSLFVCFLTSSTTVYATSGSTPKATPPALTFGHEIFTSIPATSFISLILDASKTYSSMVFPYILTITGVLNCFKNGILFSINASIPIFSRPMAFSMPQGVSTTLGGLFPKDGSRERPFTIMAPKLSRSIKSLNSSPYPNVPEAVITGFLSARPPISVFNLE